MITEELRDEHREHEHEEQLLHQAHEREEHRLHEAHVRVEEELHDEHVREEEELHAAHEREEHENEHGHPKVWVENLKTNKSVDFHVEWHTTLGKVWDRAYEELHETRGAKDEFECQDGTSLQPYLHLTLEQAREQNICKHRKFQIVGEPGGA